MAKRGKHGSDQDFGQKDNPIGLTGAFDPISIDESPSYDDPVGLTQAFGPVEDVEAEERNWDSSSKWDGFDWSTPSSESQAGSDGADEAAAAWIAAVEEAKKGGGRGRHARRAAKKEDESETSATPTGSVPKVSARMERSRKTRKRLVITVVLLLILVAALGVAGFRLLTGSFPFIEQPQEEQVQDTSAEAPAAVAPSSQDSQEVSTQQADIPMLTELFGKTQDEAIKQIGHGAIVTSTATSNEEDSVIKQTVTVELSDEPGSPRSGGTPKVYLGLDEHGSIIQVGYSAPAGLLGYGTLNFQDAVAKEHIIEKTLKAIGADVEEGTVALPKDEKKYTTYDADGTTVVKERYSFDGDVDVNGIPCSWSAVLSYDYTSANISGNASETVRLMYVYLTQK